MADSYVAFDAKSLMPDLDLPLSMQREIPLLALAVFLEARGESFDGKYAVANVVLNRVRAHSWYGNTIPEVLLKRYQFSCFNRARAMHEYSDMILREYDAWEECVQASLLAYGGAGTDNTGGADHYCAQEAKPDWKTKFRKTAEIGRHEFFSSVG
jgi:spore germination cell wall hydrolase CwlJ-like protein